MKVINIMAMSVDGRIGAFPLESDTERFASGITSTFDHNHVAAEIYRADLIIIGANTLRASGTVWAIKNDRKILPTWAILTRKGIDPTLAFWQQEGLNRVLVSPQPVPVLGDRGENLVCGSAHPGRFLLDWAQKQGLERILVFGGGAINGMFYEAGLIDELKLTVAPTLIGRRDAPLFVDHEKAINARLRLISTQIVDHFIFLHYEIVRKPMPES